MIFPHLQATDPELHALVVRETARQRDSVRLIASENYVSQAVLDASASVLTNKYSEGYAGARYYEGQEVIDEVERLAIARAKALFSAEHANVQPYSGSPANLAVYVALCDPGDPILGMGLPAGGHLTHGWKVSATGKFFRAVQYGVRREDARIDYEEVQRLAREHRPKVIVCGATAYPRHIDFARFRAIADEVGAWLLADMAHIAGLVAAGVHPSPVPHAHVVSTTTHKTLRGPRGGMLLCRADLAKKIDRAVFPGLQGGPHNHTTAGIAVALHEAATPEFRAYAAQIVKNAQALAAALGAEGFDVVSGGTDNHLVLCDVTRQGVGGKPLARAMNLAGLEANYNSVPFDPRPPMDPSGIRLGTAAVTSRGFREAELGRVASWIARCARAVDHAPALEEIRREVVRLCADFPAPGMPA